MRLGTLSIKGFRSYQSVALRFDPAITTLVGENNVGKSTVWQAVQRLLLGGHGIGQDDYPYGVAAPLTLAIDITLSDEELHGRDGVIERMRQGFASYVGDDASLVHEWLRGLGSHITVQIDQPSMLQQPVLRWGELTIAGQGCTYNAAEADARLATGPLEQIHGFIRILKDTGSPDLQGTYALPFYTHSYIVELAQRVLKYVAEFRAEAVVGQRTGSIETTTGSETASVLLNLKNHSSRIERERYRAIVSAFTTLFPRYETMEAVERTPGSGEADIQFWEVGRDHPLTLGYVSAGVKQVLTLLTILIGRQGLTLLVEHPEQHLHPHGMRYLQSLLGQASARNQIIVVTHDPHFIDPQRLVGLHRVWWTAARGSEVHGLDCASAEQDDRGRAVQTAQFKTVFRHLGNREMVFARAVVLAEDESQQEFLVSIAETLGYDLNAHGISLLSVGGEAGYRPFIALLRALAIPFLCLKDKPWGNDRQYPADQFLAFGKEIEEYLDDHGLAEQRQAVRDRYGTSKRRSAALLGAELCREQIPMFFDTLLARAVALGTGGPAATGEAIT